MEWDLTNWEVLRGLLNLPPPLTPRVSREETLAIVVLGLLMEVEALRTTVRKVAESSLPPDRARAAVSDAYREIALLTHDSTRMRGACLPGSGRIRTRSSRDTRTSR